LYIAAKENKLAIVRCLVKELGADVNQANDGGLTPMCAAAEKVDIALMRCLVKEFGVDVNKGNVAGAMLLYIAAVKGHLEMVRCLVDELGADVNQADDKGCTPLMIATLRKHVDVVRWLIKAGAGPQPADGSEITAAMFSKHVDAPAEQTAYLEAKTHCSHFGCSSAGVMKCMGCRQARYCGEACKLAH
jgi:ankyrin repeat protein